MRGVSLLLVLISISSVEAQRCRHSRFSSCGRSCAQVVDRVTVLEVGGYYLAPFHGAVATAYGARDYSPPAVANRQPAQAPQSSSAVQGLEKVQDAIVSKIEQMDRGYSTRLAAIEKRLGISPPDPVPPAPVADWEPAEIIQRHCGKCHGGEAEIGGGITLAKMREGGMNLKAYVAVDTGKMPQKSTLPADVREQLKAAILAMKL